MKICTECKITKSTSAFSVCKITQGGRLPICLNCLRISRTTLDGQPAKICRYCFTVKALNVFVKNAGKKDGYEAECKECCSKRGISIRKTVDGKKKQADRDARCRKNNPDKFYERGVANAARGSAFLNEFRSVPCTDCKKSYPVECMDFDHVAEEKIAGVVQMKTYTREKILTEIAKCEVVCSACHRIRTVKRLGDRPPSKDKRMRVHKELINSIKQDTPCIDCNLVLQPCAMDFDHVRGTKVEQISLMQRYTEGEILDEIAKCDLVCSNCHRIRTTKRNEEKRKSGAKVKGSCGRPRNT